MQQGTSNNLIIRLVLRLSGYYNSQTYYALYIRTVSVYHLVSDSAKDAAILVDCYYIILSRKTKCGGGAGWYAAIFMEEQMQFRVGKQMSSHDSSASSMAESQKRERCDLCILRTYTDLDLYNSQ